MKSNSTEKLNNRKGGSVGNIILVIFCLVILLPMVTLMIWAFTERWAWPDLIPQVFSFRAINSIVRDGGELAGVFFSSILISLVVATLAVLFGAMTSRALICYDFKGKSAFRFLTVLPFLVPATVFAMGIQIRFIKLGLSGTVAGVIIVHLICSLPYSVRLLEDGTRAVGTRLEEQARVLGAGPVQAFRLVTLPNLLPVMLSAFSMAYIVSFSQYFLTLMIGGGSVKTFTVVMVPFLTGGQRNFASVYALIFLI
ncbi:MAG: ABC transporter permease subunit, partial [Parasporobacterium sp.]|nr:ABC transporter permease subunit [Parasporobacterium sp.]